MPLKRSGSRLAPRPVVNRNGTPTRPSDRPRVRLDPVQVDVKHRHIESGFLGACQGCGQVFRRLGDVVADLGNGLLQDHHEGGFVLYKKNPYCFAVQSHDFLPTSALRGCATIEQCGPRARPICEEGVKDDGRRSSTLRTLSPFGGPAERMTHEPTSESENRFEDESRQFALLVNSVTDYALYMLDPSGVIQTWNPGGQRIKGYQAADVVGTNFSRFYLPEEAQAGLPERNLRTAALRGAMSPKAGGCAKTERAFAPVW